MQAPTERWRASPAHTPPASADTSRSAKNAPNLRRAPRAVSRRQGRGVSD